MIGSGFYGTREFLLKSLGDQRTPYPGNVGLRND
jgi:hypothetical protein